MTGRARRAVPGATTILVLGALALAHADAADEAPWALLRAGGQVIVMRHAATDRSLGDPPGFRLDDCSTQRNLSDEGRAQARRVGAAFATRGIPIGRVLSSQWRAGHGATRTARHVETPCPGVRAFTRTAMFPYGWLFSSISWWHCGMSSKA